MPNLIIYFHVQKPIQKRFTHFVKMGDNTSDVPARLGLKAAALAWLLMALAFKIWRPEPRPEAINVY